MKTFFNFPIKFLAIPLILAVGIFLIYLTAVNFLAKQPSPEINIETNGKGQQNSVKKDMVGNSAPDFGLSGIDGKKISLTDFKNKFIILSFWTTWNPAAQDQLAILDSYYKDIQNDSNISLLAINNLENKNLVLNFIKRGGYNLPILLDEEGEIGELYGIRVLPATFFINKNGEIEEIVEGVLNIDEIKNKVEKLFTK